MSEEALTIFCHNLAEDVTESILYDLFVQAGPVENVRIPKANGKNQGYAFIVYKHKCSVKYALALFRDAKVNGRTIAIRNRTLEAEKEAEMRNKSLRNDEETSFQGPSNVFGCNYMNADGSSSNYLENDECLSLGDESKGFTQPIMFSPDFSGDSYSSLSPQAEMNVSPQRCYINPYSSPFINYYDRDLQGSPRSYDNEDWSKDTYDTMGSGSSRTDSNGSRRDRSFDNSLLDRFSDDDMNY